MFLIITLFCFCLFFVIKSCLILIWHVSCSCFCFMFSIQNQVCLVPILVKRSYSLGFFCAHDTKWHLIEYFSKSTTLIIFLLTPPMFIAKNQPNSKSITTHNLGSFLLMLFKYSSMIFFGTSYNYHFQRPLLEQRHFNKHHTRIFKSCERSRLILGIDFW